MLTACCNPCLLACLPASLRAAGQDCTIQVWEVLPNRGGSHPSSPSAAAGGLEGELVRDESAPLLQAGSSSLFWCPGLLAGAALPARSSISWLWNGVCCGARAWACIHAACQLQPAEEAVSRPPLGRARVRTRAMRAPSCPSNPLAPACTLPRLPRPPPPRTHHHLSLCCCLKPAHPCALPCLLQPTQQPAARGRRAARAAVLLAWGPSLAPSPTAPTPATSRMCWTCAGPRRR